MDEKEYIDSPEIQNEMPSAKDVCEKKRMQYGSRFPAYVLRKDAQP